MTAKPRKGPKFDPQSLKTVRGFADHLVHPPNGGQEALLSLPCQSQLLLSARGGPEEFTALGTAPSVPGQPDCLDVLFLSRFCLSWTLGYHLSSHYLWSHRKKVSFLERLSVDEG